jgi:hypothetical protein
MLAAALALVPAIPPEPIEPPPETWILSGPTGTVYGTPPVPIDVSLLYFMHAKQRFTRFATLSVKGVPAGATITVTCKGGCPRKTQTVTSAKSGTIKLSAWLRKRLTTGATLTIAIARPGMKTMTKTLTMRPERRPRIVTKSGS